MEIRTRDFIEWRYNPEKLGFDYFLNEKPLVLGDEDHKDYIQRRVTTEPGIDLHHGPALVVCMGLMQSADVPHLTEQEVRADLESGRRPYLNKFIRGLCRDKGDFDSFLLRHMGEGIERMSRGYFRMFDEVFGDPALQMPPPKTYLLSYDSVEKRAKLLYDFATADQNTFISPESIEFVQRCLGPYLGEECVLHTENGSTHLEIRNPKSTVEIIKALENLVFVGNSTGANFIVEVENVLQQTLQKAHFTQTDAKAIMGSIRAVGIGQLGQYEKLSGPRFTSIFFEGINDLVSLMLNPHKAQISQEEIDKYCHPSQLKLLSGVAQQHLDALQDMKEGRTRVHARTLPLTEKQIFIPRPQADDNRMFVLAALPMDRKKWAITRRLFGPIRQNDDATESQFKAMLDNVTTDKNGHSIAYSLVQGYPPFYLVALVHRILRNMVAYPSLPEKEKKQFTAQDFMTRNLMRYNLDLSGGFVAQQDMLQEAVRRGLEIARNQTPTVSVRR